MVFIFLNLFDLLEFLFHTRNKVLTARVGKKNFSDKDIDIIKFVRRVQNFTSGILT